MRGWGWWVLLLSPGWLAAVELRAPGQVPVDSQVSVEIVGEVNPRAFVSIVAPELPEGEYERYAYARSAQVKVPAPTAVGQYQVRLLDADSPYRTLATLPIEVVMPDAEVRAPAEVPVGKAFEARWRGPSGSQEFISLLPAGTPDGEYEHYQYARGTGSGVVKLTAPTEPGDYELRYMTGSASVVIARQAVRVGDVSATLQAPAEAALGSTISIEWTGPGNPLDFITIVAPDAAADQYSDYVYTRDNPLQLTVPEQPGDFEIRYLSADSSRIYARAALRVGGATASLDAPDSVEAGAEFMVSWQGPNNDLDYVAVTAVGKPGDYRGYNYTRRGSPLPLGAPEQPGEYELHYLTGRTDQSLASRPLRVVPSARPGRLLVLANDAAAPAAGAASASIALILDASGSMLQRLDGQRRIDIARHALLQLVNEQIQPGTAVALRVFGHRKADACDTELLAPLAPLQRDSMSAMLRAIEAKNLARTPIAASLALVAEDLAAVEGSANVILVTDGEETCDGDPEAEVRRLRQLGFAVTLNIVGFAVDDYALEQDFRRWAALGGGGYFAARDASALASSIAQASRQTFSVHTGDRQVAAGAVGDAAIELKPGRYELRAGTLRQSVDILAGEETRVVLR